jgi:hypothetical protein
MVGAMFGRSRGITTLFVAHGADRLAPLRRLAGRRGLLGAVPGDLDAPDGGERVRRDPLSIEVDDALCFDRGHYG